MNELEVVPYRAFRVRLPAALPSGCAKAGIRAHESW